VPDTGAGNMLASTTRKPVTPRTLQNKILLANCAPFENNL
jgi:hypothetical protein